MLTKERHAARAIVTTPAGDVLLLQIRDPLTGDRYWVTPGGGVEPGESALDALSRELVEELGQHGLPVGALVLERTTEFVWAGCHVTQHERFYHVAAAHFVPRVLDPEEADIIVDLRWWTRAEIEAASVPLSPRELPALLADLVPSRR